MLGAMAQDLRHAAVETVEKTTRRGVVEEGEGRVRQADAAEIGDGALLALAACLAAPSRDTGR